MMNQAHLVRRMAQGTRITQPQAAQVLRIVMESMQIALRGFGTFAVRSRAACRGRHPQTGQEIFIRACKVPRFNAGKWVREAIQSR
jgi:DNA-binding protein HU-beta